MKTAQEQFIEYIEARLQEQQQVYADSLNLEYLEKEIWDKITKPGDYSLSLDLGLTQDDYYRPVTTVMKLLDTLGYECKLTYSNSFRNERLIVKVDDQWISNLVKYHALKGVALAQNTNYTGQH